ncbi:SurA N-terminal domain-containing protein [Lederbergia sp. NSJ-179]|uniref:SurA N-terminal domain-containing protein n=1 Tax=Lederbergia sp. NSJ-179 TaxID=2931402 RepID=UPI001FD434A6|nr:SurA N-terminal domain-containing protein [Lederbergia sp. NSJ-179]MCJ7841658.1 SurA N-terminal domain-containing protein [Lederbergia sp. NSJ-179]
MKKSWLLMLSFILIAGILAACGDKDNEEGHEGSEGNGNEKAATEMPKPDLEGIPDVVAKVNDEEVLKEDFENMYQGQFQQLLIQAQMSGQGLDDLDQDQLKKQVAEGMVGQTLLIQEANNTIKNVSDDDINKTIDEFIAEYDMESKDELLKVLKKQGVAEDEFMSQVETQVKLDQLIAKVSGDIEPSEDEIKEAYESMKAQQEETGSDQELPSFDEAKSQIADELKESKQQEATQKYVAELRKDADVTINL